MGKFNVWVMNPAGVTAVGKTPEACFGQKCFNLFNTALTSPTPTGLAKKSGIWLRLTLQLDSDFLS